MQSLSCARATMAAPAFLLFVATCLAAGIREGVGGDINEKGGSGDDDLSLGRHRGRHGGGHPPEPRGNELDGSFDFYVYSMSHQPEFCRMNDEKFAGCKHPSEAWEGQLTVHGLWPNRNDGSWPSACSDEKFDLSLLTGLSDDLVDHWPNVKAPSDASPGHEAFWAHEWSKHGTCSGMTQRDYFLTALELLLPTPGVVKENYGSVVERAELEDGYGGNGMTVLVCKAGYLSEVRACFEKMGDGAPGERVMCPSPLQREDSCGNEINIASFEVNTVVAIE